jgi:hypothetical protein
LWTLFSTNIIIILPIKNTPEKSMLTLRLFHPSDFDLLLDLANQAVPFAPGENAEWLAYRRAFDDTKYLRRHYLAVDDAIPRGYGCLEQQGADRTRLRIYVVCGPADLERQAVLYHLLEDANELGASTCGRASSNRIPRYGSSSPGMVLKRRFNIPYPIMRRWSSSSSS